MDIFPTNISFLLKERNEIEFSKMSSERMKWIHYRLAMIVRSMRHTTQGTFEGAGLIRNSKA